MKNVSVFSEILSSIADRGLSFLDLARARTDATDEEALCQLSEQLLTGRGEASGIALAMEILNGYDALSDDEKATFFHSIAERFGPPADALATAAAAYLEVPSDERAAALTAAAEPRRLELIRRLNQAPDATYRLVRMREDLLQRLDDAPELQAVDADFAHLFSSWFNRGFLELRSLDWNTSAAILEKVIQYEAVHEISDWNALRERIAPADRRLYGFFHPRLGDEPLIFVEVALTRDIPDSIDAVLSGDRERIDPKSAKAAIFYSISNCQTGLRGVSFGSFLIKQVVRELQRDLPALKTFSTLSPVPGFARWLRRRRKVSKRNGAADEELAALEQADWWRDEEKAAELQRILMPLAARYLLSAKNKRDRPLDPVAQFHLGNGAILERINWLADTSANGMRQSHGIMVNYLYKLADIEDNHEAYANSGTVAASGNVLRLAK